MKKIQAISFAFAATTILLILVMPAIVLIVVLRSAEHTFISTTNSVVGRWFSNERRVFMDGKKDKNFSSLMIRNGVVAMSMRMSDALDVGRDELLAMVKEGKGYDKLSELMDEHEGASCDEYVGSTVVDKQALLVRMAACLSRCNAMSRVDILISFVVDGHKPASDVPILVLMNYADGKLVVYKVSMDVQNETTKLIDTLTMSVDGNEAFAIYINGMVRAKKDHQ